MTAHCWSFSNNLLILPGYTRLFMLLCEVKALGVPVGHNSSCSRSALKFYKVKFHSTASRTVFNHALASQSSSALLGKCRESNTGRNIPVTNGMMKHFGKRQTKQGSPLPAELDCLDHSIQTRRTGEVGLVNGSQKGSGT